MCRQIWKVSGLLTLSFTIGTIIPEARAYVPPSSYVIRTLAKKHLGPKSVRFKNTLISFDGQKASGIALKEIALIDYATRTVRSKVMDEAGRELYFFERRVDPTHAPLGQFILVEPSADRIMAALKSAGIPVRPEAELRAMSSEEDRRKSEVSQMGRWNGTVAWVFGQPKNQQLWIEKDTFHPVKILFQKEGSLAEVQYEKYRYVREYPFPRTITVFPKGVGNEGAIRIESNDITIDPESGEFKNFTASGFTDAGNSLDSNTRQTITTFYQYFR